MTFPESLSILPIAPNTKKPTVTTWSSDTPRTHTDDVNPDASYAVICGSASGNLEGIDYDIKHLPPDIDPDVLFDAYLNIIAQSDPTLCDALYIQRTQSGGRHIIYRCPNPGGNQKLAKLSHSPQAIFETRGHGGYLLIPPSQGYEPLQNTLHTIPTITQEQRDLLISTAKSFGDPEPERAVAPAPKQQFHDFTLSPLDDYDARADSNTILDILTQHGWTYAYSRNDTHYLTRPGKTPKEGVSASVNHPKCPNRLYVFSTSTNFDAPRSYKPSSVYGLLIHHGDFNAAARALAAEGYGNRITRTRQTFKTADGETLTINAAELSADHVRKRFYEHQTGDAHLFHDVVGPSVAFDAHEKQWYRYNDYDTHRAPHWHAVSPSHILNMICAVVASRYKALGAHLTQEQQSLEAEMAVIAEQEFPAEQKQRFEDLRQRSAAIKKTTEALYKRNESLHTARYLKGVRDLAEAHLECNSGIWDSDPWVLGVANGVIDLRTGELMPPDPMRYIRKYAPTAYQPNADAPRFRQFITEIFNEDGDANGTHGDAYEGPPPVPALSDYIHKLLGYSITGITSVHVSPILYGPAGRNGKDTLLNTLFSVLGSNLCGPIAREVLIEGRKDTGANASPHLYALKGKRLVWVNETEETDRVKAGQLKALTGGSLIVCRPLYGGQVEFIPTHLPLLVSNYKPSIPNEDDAIWKRVILIPFTVTFVDAPNGPNQRKADIGLPAALQGEQEGILAWLIEGCLRWQREGLDKPAVVTSASDSYRVEMDTLSEFFDTVLRPRTVEAKTVKEAFIPVGELFKAYKLWSRQQMESYPIKSVQRFSAICRRHLGESVTYGKHVGYVRTEWADGWRPHGRIVGES